MATLIDRIFTVATGTTIIIGALPPMYEPADDIVRQYNRDLAELVSKRSAAGQKIFLVDMHSPVCIFVFPAASEIMFASVFYSDNMFCIVQSKYSIY